MSLSLAREILTQRKGPASLGGYAQQEGLALNLREDSAEDQQHPGEHHQPGRCHL